MHHPMPAAFWTMLLMGVALLATGCEVGPRAVLAPTDSAIALSTTQTALPIRSSLDVTIVVTRQDGSPVEDGTAVVLTATVGELEQQKVLTRGGRATVQYRAGSEPGVARIQAVSGSARAELALYLVSAPVAAISLAAEPAVLPEGGGDADLRAAVTGPAGEAVRGAPVEFRVSAGTLDPNGPVMSDERGLARARVRTTTPLRAYARVDAVQSAEVVLRLRVPAQLNLTVTPERPVAGSPVAVAVSARTANGDPVRGRLVVAFGDGSATRVEPFGGDAAIEHVYRQGGDYELAATLIDADGTESRALRRLTVAAAPPGPSPSADELDPRLVTWLHADVARWTRSSTIRTVRITASEICIDHTMAGRWPPSSPLGPPDVREGNPWVIANVNGVWYAATYDWLRPGDICRAMTADQIGPHTSVGGRSEGNPLHTWRPRSGEMVGFLVSTPARNEVRSINERSNIVLVRWP